MSASEIGDQYNIAPGIVRKAEALGLDAMATGGGVDYVYKALGKNADGSDRVAILSSKRVPGSPDSLSEGAEISLMLDEAWLSQVSIPFRNAKEAIEALARMYDPYAD